MEGFLVNVSNISNEGTDEQIQQYLSLVGPIKQIRITRQQRRVLAKVAYYDGQTAMMAVNHLGGTSFKARDLKITVAFGDEKKDAKGREEEEEILEDLAVLRGDEKAKLAHLVLNFAKEQGEEFTKFLGRHPKIVEGLMGVKMQR